MKTRDLIKPKTLRTSPKMNLVTIVIVTIAFFLLGSERLIGQEITASSTSPGDMGTHQLNNYYAIDQGTNAYYLNVPSISWFSTIYRNGGYWYIRQRQAGFGHDELFKYPVLSSAIDPPCTGNWDRSNFSTPSTITGTINITMTPSNGANCSTPPNPPVHSTIIDPLYVGLAQLDNAEINAIPNPQPGMMTWSRDDSCVKMYNGTSWNCL